MSDVARLQKFLPVDVTADECWPWQGYVDSRSGYGAFRLDGRSRNAHRAAYLLLVGPIQPGLEVDHLCRNRRCVNPAHLEPVTVAENQRRGRLARLSGQLRPCGHPRPNTPDAVSGDCPECARARTRRQRESGRVPGTITCADCGEAHPLCARGLCRNCYTRWYRLTRGRRARPGRYGAGTSAIPGG